MLRRIATVLVVALLTSGASLWWLYDGDLGQVHPALASVDASEVSAWLGRSPDGSLPDEERVRGAGHPDESRDR